MSGPYHVWVIAFDMEGRSEGDLQDFQTFLHRHIEPEYPGAHLLGSDVTHGWPSYRVFEAGGSVPGEQEASGE